MTGDSSGDPARSGDPSDAPSEALVRRLGTTDAVMIGLGSMIGAGVFAAFGPAAKAAGTGLLIGLVMAAMIAYCNAVASAQLAAVYPTSGGTYVYGRERLGDWWGFAAGWGFVIGKTASCAAMALTSPPTPCPAGWAQRLAAVVAVVGLAALNYRGITKTALLTRVLVVASLTALAVAVVGVAVGGHATRTISAIGRRSAPAAPTASSRPPGCCSSLSPVMPASPRWVRKSVTPQRTIPRAILIALFLTVAVYLAVGVAALLAAGPEGLARASAPLVAAVAAAGADGVAPVVRIGAAWPHWVPCWRCSPGSAAPASRWPATATCPAGWPPYTPAIGCRTTPKSPSPCSSPRWCSSPTCAA